MSKKQIDEKIVELMNKFLKDNPSIAEHMQKSESTRKKILEILENNNHLPFSDLEQIAMIIDHYYVKHIKEREKNNDLKFSQDELAKLFDMIFHDNKKISNILFEELIKLKKREYYIELFFQNFDYLEYSKLSKIMEIVQHLNVDQINHEQISEKL